MVNDKWTKAVTDHIRMKLPPPLVGADCTTNNVRSVVSISGGQGRPFNHGLRGAEPLYHHWTVSRANCGYISLSLWPAHRNDLLACCRAAHTHPAHIVLRGLRGLRGLGMEKEHQFTHLQFTCKSIEKFRTQGLQEGSSLRFLKTSFFFFPLQS